MRAARTFCLNSPMSDPTNSTLETFQTAEKRLTNSGRMLMLITAFLGMVLRAAFLLFDHFPSSAATGGN